MEGEGVGCSDGGTVLGFAVPQNLGVLFLNLHLLDSPQIFESSDWLHHKRLVVSQGFLQFGGTPGRIAGNSCTFPLCLSCCGRDMARPIGGQLWWKQFMEKPAALATQSNSFLLAYALLFSCQISTACTMFITRHCPLATWNPLFPSHFCKNCNIWQHPNTCCSGCCWTIIDNRLLSNSVTFHIFCRIYYI